MPTDTREQLWVTQILEQLGLRAEPLPVTPAAPIPTIKAHDDQNTYLVEIKTATSDAPAEPPAASESQPFAAFNEPDAIRLFWFTADAIETDKQWQQVYTALFGIRKILDTATETVRDCLYFDASVFSQNSPQLDGAILAWPRDGLTTLTLFVNQLSSHLPLVRASVLYLALADGAYDPPQLESENRVYIADHPLDPGNAEAAIAALQTKYNNPSLVALPPSNLPVRVIPFKNGIAEPPPSSDGMANSGASLN